MDQTRPMFSQEFLKEVSEMDALDALLALYHQYQDQWEVYSQEEGGSFVERYPEFVVEARALFLALAEKHELTNIKPPQVRNYSINEFAKFDTFMHELLGLIKDSRLKILADSYEKSFKRMLASAEFSQEINASSETPELVSELAEFEQKLKYDSQLN
jgi:hypothetical protein